MQKNDLTTIHNTSIHILETCGVRFGIPRVVDVFKQNGFKTNKDIVYFEHGPLMELVKKAPETFTLFARNPEHNMTLGNDQSYYAPGYGAPTVILPDGSRRQALFEDYITLVKLVHQSPYFHINGGILAQPSDLDPETAFASMLHAAVTYSDKCLIAGGGRARENQMVMDMMTIVTGGEAAFKSRPHIMALINTTSPLMIDSHSLETLMAYVENGQAVMITPATMAGTTGPVTLAGTIALANAEVLAGIALTQLLRPGAPVMYGFQSDTADMRTGSIGRGSPEGALCFKYGAAMAGFYRLPCRGGGSVTCAKTVSVQAGYEGMLTLLASRQANMNLMIHSAGMMDADAAMSFEKFMVDLDIIGMVERFVKGIDINEESLALDEISQVGPGGEFLTRMHTMKHCRNESWIPAIGLRGNKANENPEQALKHKISSAMKKMLRDYQQPHLSPETANRLDEYLEQQGIQACNG